MADDKALLEQRIRYLLTEGGAYPSERPATRPLVVRLALTLVALETINLVAILYLALHG